MRVYFVDTRRDISDVIGELRQVEAERDQLLHDLTERVKELQCLYKLGTFIEQYDELEDILLEFVEYLPPAWQYPEITAARIFFNDLEFTTIDFCEGVWKQDAPILVGGTLMGAVEIFYTEERAEVGEGPFLNEERDLINEVANRLGHVAEKLWAEKALEVTHEECEELEHRIRQSPEATGEEGGSLVKIMVPFRSITEIQQGAAARDRIWHNLGERIKELQCLYALGILIEKADNIEDLFQEFVQALPPAWQYPELACARIIFNDQVFSTPNFRETGWVQSAIIATGGTPVGNVEVYYLDEMPVEYEGPFLKEERELINEVARRLGRVAERLMAEAALDVAQEEREKLEQALKIRDSLL